MRVFLYFYVRRDTDTGCPVMLLKLSSKGGNIKYPLRSLNR